MTKLSRKDRKISPKTKRQNWILKPSQKA